MLPFVVLSLTIKVTSENVEFDPLSCMEEVPVDSVERVLDRAAVLEDILEPAITTS